MSELHTIYVTSNIFTEPKKCVVFHLLLENTHLMDDTDVALAYKNKTIAFSKLKDIAIKANIPYPLFFASVEKITKQIEREKELVAQSGISFNENDKVKINFRGNFNIQIIYTLIKDLCRRQRFMSRRLIAQPQKNLIVGLIAKNAVNDLATTLATKISRAIDFKVGIFRSGNKTDGLKYLVQCSENSNILLSFSSYHHMSQNLPKKIDMSGLCMRDKYYPLIFINTKDHENEASEEAITIFEPEGRQTLTIMTMIVCIAMNHFSVSSFDDKNKSPNPILSS